jgi:flagellar basal body rod protein FlgF
MKNKILIASLTTVFAGAVSTASLAGNNYMTDSAADVTDMAAGTAETVTETFMAIDANGDGMISVEEAQGSPALTDGFAASDTNQDGQLDAAEFSAFEAATDAPDQ